jgi:hypothetical protein
MPTLLDSQFVCRHRGRTIAENPLLASYLREQLADLDEEFVVLAEHMS